MISYRHVLPVEAGALADHLKRLPDDARATRFFCRYSDEAVDGYVRRIDWAHAIVIGAFEGGELRGVAEVAVAGSGGELSLTVEPGWQHRHIATELTRRVLQSARNQWLADICIRYLRGNTPIGRIAGAVAHHTHADEGELVSGVRIPVPTPASVWNELLDESAGWAGDMLDRAASVPGPRP